MDSNVQQLERILEHVFRDKSLLITALTHPSYLHEAAGATGGDYQRLEFLGDSVLSLLLSELLFTVYPHWDEGALSRLRARLAGQDVLADRARMLGLGGFILLGRGEEHTAGREKDSILSDVLEAVIAALYQDGGLPLARSLVARLFQNLAVSPELLTLGRDSKSELQEYLSACGHPPPEYRLTEESGPPHAPQFCFQIWINGMCAGSGCGKSKKNAQQAAASCVLKELRSADGPML